MILCHFFLIVIICSVMCSSFLASLSICSMSPDCSVPEYMSHHSVSAVLLTLYFPTNYGDQAVTIANGGHLGAGHPTLCTVELSFGLHNVCLLTVFKFLF